MFDFLKKGSLVFAITILSLSSASAKLSLKQKKMKKKSEVVIAKHSLKIKSACGCSPKVKIGWETFKTQDDFLIANRSMSNVADALKKLCKEYKTEVCSGVKTIFIDKSKTTKTFKGGTLSVSRAKSGEGYGASSIIKALEEGL